MDCRALVGLDRGQLMADRQQLERTVIHAAPLRPQTFLGGEREPAQFALLLSFLTVVVVLGLAWRDIIPWWLVVLLLTRDVVMGAALVWWHHRGSATPRVTMLGKSATFALYVFLPLAYLAFERWDGVHSFAIWAAAVSAVAYWGAAVQYLAQLRHTRSHAPNSA